MKRLALVLALALAAVACGDDDTTAGPATTTTTTPATTTTPTATTAPTTTTARATTTTTRPAGPTPTVTGGGTSFGECGGLCVSELRIDGAMVALDRRSWDRAEEVAGRGSLTAEGRARLAGIESELVGVALEETYGCPDCADGGAAWIDLIVDVEGRRSTYEFSVAPAPLADWDRFLADVSDALATCTSDSLVDVADDCATEPADGGLEIVGGGFSFGMCLGYCVTDLEVAGATVLLTRSPWDVIDGDDLAPQVVAGTLTADGRAELDRVGAALRDVVLRDTYGCPDCADGGSGWVIVRDAAGQRQSTFEYFDPPAELRAADELLRSLIDTLRECASDGYVTTGDDCVPASDPR